MFDVWRMRQARKAAVASIAPFVETSRHRLNGIAESVWLDPYMVGFVGTLVTLAAERRSATLRTQAMGLVQADAWADITGARPDLIGEEICFLSAGRSKDFETGCRNAARFFGALCGKPPGAGSDVGSIGLAMRRRRCRACPSLTVTWERSGPPISRRMSSAPGRTCRLETTFESLSWIRPPSGAGRLQITMRLITSIKPHECDRCRKRRACAAARASPPMMPTRPGSGQFSAD